MARADDADGDRARNGDLPRRDAARRTGAQIGDRAAVHDGEEFAVAHAVERHDVTDADPLGQVVRLGRAVARLAVGGKEDPNPAAREGRAEARGYRGLARRLMGIRRLEQVDRLLHPDHTGERLRAEGHRHGCLPVGTLPTGPDARGARRSNRCAVVDSFFTDPLPLLPDDGSSGAGTTKAAPSSRPISLPPLRSGPFRLDRPSHPRQAMTI